MKWIHIKASWFNFENKERKINTKWLEKQKQKKELYTLKTTFAQIGGKFLLLQLLMIYYLNGFSQDSTERRSNAPSKTHCAEWENEVFNQIVMRYVIDDFVALHYSNKKIWIEIVHIFFSFKWPVKTVLFMPNTQEKMKWNSNDTVWKLSGLITTGK